MTATNSNRVALHFRLDEAEADRLDKLCDRFPGAKAVVARRALEIGMSVLEADPAAFARDLPTTPAPTTSESVEGDPR